jgi:hypothetical protein
MFNAGGRGTAIAKEAMPPVAESPKIGSTAKSAAGWEAGSSFTPAGTNGLVRQQSSWQGSRCDCDSWRAGLSCAAQQERAGAGSASTCACCSCGRQWLAKNAQGDSGKAAKAAQIETSTVPGALILELYAIARIGFQTFMCGSRLGSSPYLQVVFT